MSDYYEKKDKGFYDSKKDMASFTKLSEEYCVKSRYIFLFLCTFSIVIIILMISWLAVDNSMLESVTAIIVPGGGLTKEGIPPPHTIKRLDRAREIYHKLVKNGDSAVIITLSAGLDLIL